MGKDNYLFAKESGHLQFPYREYVALIKQVEEGTRLRNLKEAIVADLQRFMEGCSPEIRPQVEVPRSAPQAALGQSPNTLKEGLPKKTKEEPHSMEQPEPKASAAETPLRSSSPTADIPPIKKDIVEHFNSRDESGRIFNVFKQYYTCLNEVCGGTVRVTIKDGLCSLWNYDAWEEFAFVDIFEGCLRIAVDPSHTDALKSLSLCEAPRLLSSRRNVICVQVDALSKRVLEVLARAFEEVGTQAK